MRRRESSLLLAGLADVLMTDESGVISYGASPPERARRAAYDVDWILRGARPPDLPVEEPTIRLRASRILH